MSSEHNAARGAGSPAGRRAVVAVTALVSTLMLGGCAVRQHVAGSAIPLEQEQVEELATFQCVTSQAAVQLRTTLEPEDEAYARGALLYQNTRDAFNPIVEGIARDVRRGSKVDVDAYWARLGTAREHQLTMLTFVEQQAAGMGFVGIETLAAIALPYAKRMFRSFVDRQIRDYAADYLEDELLLPPLAETDAECVVEES